jgi:hypothetical protein
MRFAPRRPPTTSPTFSAYKAKVVDGPLNMGSPFYRIRLSETKLPKEEVGASE